MSQSGRTPLTVLHDIATSPGAWYPRAYVEATGAPRDEIDQILERLRMLGLVELTPWEALHGQGYQVTGPGKRVLYDARLAAQLMAGTLPPARAEHSTESAPEAEWSGRGASGFERGEAIRAGLMSKSPPRITYALIALNVAVFVAGLALAVPRNSVRETLMGANSTIPVLTGALTLFSLSSGEWWRLVTACFVHFGVLHLGVNMYSLWILGPLSEKAWGRWRFLALYAISGLGGSCAVVVSMAKGWEGAGVTAGASGAIWGLMAGFGVWVLLNRSALGPALSSTWLRQIGICVLINLFLTFSVHGLSKSGHIGGGLFGVAAALLLNQQRFAGGVVHWAAALGLIVVPVAGVVAAFAVQPALAPETASVALVQDEFFDNVVPIVNQKWDERNAQEVAEARLTLAQLREQVSAATATLERKDKEPTPERERRRELLIECLRAQNELLRLADRKLELGQDWDDAGERALHEQNRAVHDCLRRLTAETGR